MRGAGFARNGSFVAQPLSSEPAVTPERFAAADCASDWRKPATAGLARRHAIAAHPAQRPDRRVDSPPGAAGRSGTARNAGRRVVFPRRQPGAAHCADPRGGIRHRRPGARAGRNPRRVRAGGRRQRGEIVLSGPGVVLGQPRASSMRCHAVRLSPRCDRGHVLAFNARPGLGRAWGRFQRGACGGGPRSPGIGSGTAHVGSGDSDRRGADYAIFLHGARRASRRTGFWTGLAHIAVACCLPYAASARCCSPV